MTWVRVDDKLPDHPKVEALGSSRLPALGLHLSALCYCSEYLTDGVVPAMKVRKMQKRLVDALVSVGLWHRLGNGDIQIHDYLDYNPSREVVQGRRESARVRMNFARTSREPNENVA